MAYVSQEFKKELTPAIKAVLKKFNMKGTISVNNHSTLVVKLKSGSIDFVAGVASRAYSQRLERMEEYYHGKCHSITGKSARETLHEDLNNCSVNESWINETYTGICRDFLNELHDAMKGPAFFCKDDAMTDYFYRSHYIEIMIGKDWKSPYICTFESLSKEAA